MSNHDPPLLPPCSLLMDMNFPDECIHCFTWHKIADCINLSCFPSFNNDTTACVYCMFPSSACRSYNNICPPTVVLLLHIYKILFYLKFNIGVCGCFCVQSIYYLTPSLPMISTLSYWSMSGAMHAWYKYKGTHLTTDEARYTRSVRNMWYQ